MKQSVSEQSKRHVGLLELGVAAACLVVIIGLMFRGGFRPGYTVASNDGPLGVIHAGWTQLPDALSGMWEDLNWVGFPYPTPLVDVTQISNLLCKWIGGRDEGPVLFSKIYAPMAIFFVGICAWICFRQWKLCLPACFLAGLAAALNSDFFSTACWGVASQPICFGFNFLALAALARVPDESLFRRWSRLLLAGCAVGLGVAEAFDIGAIFSVVVGVFVFFQAVALDDPEDMPASRAARGLGRLALVACTAGLIAAGALSSLYRTQIQLTAQQEETPAEHWSWATQWSLPKREILSLVVPGLFGYRMDTPDGGNYWGAIGRGLGWDRYFAGGPLGEGDIIRITSPVLTNLNAVVQVNRSGEIAVPGAGQIKADGKTTLALKTEISQKVAGGASAQVDVSLERPQDFLRYSGGGIYAGVLVVLVAVWTASQGFRKNNPYFSDRNRRFLIFWVLVAFISVLLGFGRFAPFYRVFYVLPGVSSIRNPAKFFHVVNWAFLFLFAFGIDALVRRCMDPALVATRGLAEQFQAWKKTAPKFDRNWVRAAIAALILSAIGWLVYAASRENLVRYLQGVDFDEATAAAIARFSSGQVFWFVVTLAFAVALFVITLSGYFCGARWRIGAGVLGLLLLLDLGRANGPWVITYDYEQKYASNPIIDFLREKPYLHRASILQSGAPFTQLYEYLWKQHLFQYYDIQSLDVIMLPRRPVEYVGFEGALHDPQHPWKSARRWQLTNNRYLLGPAAFLQSLNQQLDPTLQRFRIVTNFDLALKSGVTKYSGHLEELTTEPTPTGQYAIFEFTGALPRAALFSDWQVATNDSTALQTLASEAFDPAKTVIIDRALQGGASTAATIQTAGTVHFVSYDPRHIKLRATATVPSVLLLNDKFDSDWKVYVDAKSSDLLRCNYTMRGVFVPTGSHDIQFRFQPSLAGLYVNIMMLMGALATVAFLLVQKPAAPTTPATSPLSSKPTPGPKTTPVAQTKK